MLQLNDFKDLKAYYVEEIDSYVFEDDVTIKFPLRTFASIIALNITAGNIHAKNIRAENIDAGNINAMSINALNIKYWAICIAYESFKCRSVEGKRTHSIHKCLDQEIEFVN